MSKLEYLLKGSKVICRFHRTKDRFLPYRISFQLPGETQGTLKAWLEYRYQPSQAAARYFYLKIYQHDERPALLEQALIPVVAPALHTQAGFLAWLQSHIYEEVGTIAGWRSISPLQKYIDATQEQWKVRSFQNCGVITTMPRWMSRFQHWFAEKVKGQYPYSPGIKAYEVIRWMQEKQWGTPKYNHWRAYEEDDE